MGNPFEAWAWRDYHWHVYVTNRHDGDRMRRLATEPDHVLYDPDQVYEWIEHHANRHGERRRVKLLGSPGWAGTHDRADRRHQATQAYDVVGRGDSFYTKHGPCYVYIEAVAASCEHATETSS